MTLNPLEMIVDRTPLEKSIRLETLRAELDKEGYTIVKSAWLERLNAVILKRNLLNGDKA
jgi:hypothetical protein